MDPTIPRSAALLLDFIGDVETGRKPPEAYEVLFGHRQDRLTKPLTRMTVDEVIAAGPTWAKWGSPGSSAAGRYQFMNATLKDLKAQLGLGGIQVFDANLQDRLGFHLLKRRGYDAFMAGSITPTEFGRRLAMEWASLPVLANTKGAHRNVTRGQSYYAGDGVNKSLITPEQVEAVLRQARGANGAPVPPDYEPPVSGPASNRDWRMIVGIIAGLAAIAFIISQII